MTIASEITRLNNAKAAIKQSLANKGVEVSDSALLDEYPALIDSIEVGSGEGGSSDSESVWNIITDNGRRMEYLFYNCKISSLDISHLDTSQADDMSNMFYFCNNLTTLDVSNFNTSNVTDMGYMFTGCSGLTTLDVSNFNTSNVTDMSMMFYNCNNLTTLDVSNFNISNVTDMRYMFDSCRALTTIDVSNFVTDKVTNMSYMFDGCVGLTTITGLNNFNISKVINMSYMFYNCQSLTTLDVSNWDVGHMTASYSLSYMFDQCSSLVDLYPPKNINADMRMDKSTALSHDSLMRIINNLMTTTSTKTLTLGTTNLAKLTDEEKAIATGKGWTVK